MTHNHSQILGWDQGEVSHEAEYGASGQRAKRMLGWGIDCLGDVTCDQLGLMAS